MATEHTYSELIERQELDLPAGRFIERGVQRHVAFVILEELLQETTEPQVTVTMTIRCEDYTDQTRAYSASGQVVSAHA